MGRAFAVAGLDGTVGRSKAKAGLDGTVGRSKAETGLDGADVQKVDASQAAPALSRVLPRAERSDDALVAGMLAGCSEDFDALYARYFPRIYSFVHARIRSHADSEEIVQETFLAVFRSLDRYRGSASLLSWIYGIARNLLNNHVRSSARRRDRIELVSDERLDAASAPVTSSPSAELELEEFRRAVSSELDSLSAWQTEIFSMRHFENLSIAEISRRTRRSSDSVRSGLFRVKRVFLEHAGAEPGGARS